MKNILISLALLISMSVWAVVAPIAVTITDPITISGAINNTTFYATQSGTYVVSLSGTAITYGTNVVSGAITLSGISAVNGTLGSFQSGIWNVGSYQSGAWNVGVSGAVTVNTHAVTISGTAITYGTNVVSGGVTINGTVITYGTNVVSGGVTLSGISTVNGTLGSFQSGTWNVGVTGGTISAAQSGTWNVGAYQSGAWNVGVSGAVTVNTHAVTLSGIATVNGTTFAAQSGAWNVGVTGGTLAASQSGAWNVSLLGGTIAASQSGTWVTTSTAGTLTKVSTLDTITNPITVNTHAVTGSGVFTTSGTQFVTQLGLSAVSVSFSESAAAPTAATWYKRSQWQVPSGSTFLPDKAKSVVSISGSRTLIGTGVVMGSLNLSSNAFTDASSVSAPRFFSRMLGCVTIVMSAVSDNITVSYTDDLGNAHSSVATTFPASTPVGNCFEIPLAATTGAMRDTGFRDVTNITDSAAPTGVIEIIGMNPMHDTLGLALTFELSNIDNSAVLQNEFVWIMEMQAATTAQQRAAAIEGAIRSP
jgi:hypothetical protein